jgi:hypothetical protein
VLKEEIDMAQPENTKFTLNAIIEYQSATSQLASTSANAMATASTVSTLGSRQNSNIAYIDDGGGGGTGGNKIYISELAPTKEDNDIGNEGDLWYKVKRRGHFEGAVLKCIRAGKMTHPDMEFSVGQYVRINYGNYYNSYDPYLKGWGPTNWSGWEEYNFISLSNMEGISSKLSIWGNFPGYYPHLYGTQSLRLWTCNYDEERMITSNEVARGGFGQTAVGYNIGFQGKNHGWSTLTIGGVLNNIEYNAEESDEYMVDPSAVKSTIDGLALFEIVDWGEGTNYGYDGTIIERMVLERYVKYDGVWVKADYKAGKGIIIADGEIRINTSTSVDIIQNVTSGTQLATINDKPIYAPTVSATQTQTSGTEIATINVGDTSTKLYAPTTTVTTKTTTGTNIADIAVNGTTYQLFAPSGGGGGGGSGYTETSLWSGYKADTGTINLNDSVENYDIVLIKVTSHPEQPSNSYYESYFTILTKDIIYNQHWQYNILVVRGHTEYGNGSMDCYFSSSTSFVIESINISDKYKQVKPAVLEIVGLKFGGGGGSGSGYTADLLFENTDFSVASGTSNVSLDYTLSASIDDYDAVIVSAFLVNKATTREQVETIIINKSQYYTRAVSSGTDDYNIRWALKLNGTYQNVIRDLYFGFADDTTLKTLCRRTNSGEESKLYRVYGLKFGGSSGHNYSTEEQVIGTWIDGSTLYEKTIEYTSSIGTGWTTLYQDTSISIKDYKASIIIDNDGSTVLNVYQMASNNYFTTTTLANGNGLRIYNSGDTRLGGTITIQYTKTSTTDIPIS